MNAMIRIKRILWIFECVAIRNPERHMCKASHCGSKEQ